MNRDLTPWPPLHCGEGEEPTGHGGVVRKQKINPEKLEIAREFRKNPTESEDAVVKENDEYRTSVFESKGIKTYRLKNEDCDKQHLVALIEHIITDK